jgi:hypothetical protein
MEKQLRSFLHYLINDMVTEKNIEDNICVFSLQLLPQTFLNLRRIQRDIIINEHTSVSIESTRFQILIKTAIFLTGFQTTLKYHIL